MKRMSLPQQKRKRKESGLGCGGRKEKARRFVWPNELHREFITGIFDVGLRAATVSSVNDSILRPVNEEEILALLQRYRQARDTCTSQSSHDSKAKAKTSPLDKYTKKAIQIVQKQMKLAMASHNCINKFQPKLQGHHLDLAEIISKQHSAASGRQMLPAKRNSPLKRTQQEMRLAMNFHRKMLNTRYEALQHEEKSTLDDNGTQPHLRLRSLPPIQSQTQPALNSPPRQYPPADTAEHQDDTSDLLPSAPLDFDADDEAKLDADIFYFLMEDLPPSSPASISRP